MGPAWQGAPSGGAERLEAAWHSRCAASRATSCAGPNATRGFGRKRSRQGGEGVWGAMGLGELCRSVWASDFASDFVVLAPFNFLLLWSLPWIRWPAAWAVVTLGVMALMEHTGVLRLEWPRRRPQLLLFATSPKLVLDGVRCGVGGRCDRGVVSVGAGHHGRGGGPGSGCVSSGLWRGASYGWGDGNRLGCGGLHTGRGDADTGCGGGGR